MQSGKQTVKATNMKEESSSGFDFAIIPLGITGVSIIVFILYALGLIKF
jgi:hypothetical protein